MSQKFIAECINDECTNFNKPLSIKIIDANAQMYFMPLKVYCKLCDWICVVESSPRSAGKANNA